LKPLLLGVVALLALLVGTGIGYYPRPTNTFTMTATTTITVTSSPLNTTRVIQSACRYLASNYNASTELIAETPSHERYYPYSDNYLAVLVLPRDCNYPGLAKSINETLSRYDASKIPNNYMVFSCRQYLNGAKDFNLSDHIWTRALSPVDQVRAERL
jgi:hypothetical protein